MMILATTTWVFAELACVARSAGLEFVDSANVLLELNLELPPLDCQQILPIEISESLSKIELC
jgi:hypothetical protein